MDLTAHPFRSAAVVVIAGVLFASGLGAQRQRPAARLRGAPTPEGHLGGPGTVVAQQKISSEEGGFLDTLDAFDQFGSAVAWLGDLDGDGIGDLAVGASRDVNRGAGRGAVWVLFLAADGSVRAFRKIEGNGSGTDDPAVRGQFGASLAVVDDVNGDGIVDLAVGSQVDDDGGLDRGSVTLVFLDRDGSDKGRQKISSTQGGFTGLLHDGDQFGSALASLGDVDGDGVGDLAVGAHSDDGPGSNSGAVWVLFLRADGTVRAQQKIDTDEGGFSGTLANSDFFGGALAGLGDLDGDGVVDLAVGYGAFDLGTQGGVWILFLHADGTVKAQSLITNGQGGFPAVLDPSDFFGSSLVVLGDLDGDGRIELAVGAEGDDDGGTPGGVGGANRGAVWILSLDPDGTVAGQTKISDTQGGLVGDLVDRDAFGTSLAAPGDRDGDGVPDLLVGAGGLTISSSTGAAWILALDADGSVGGERRIRAGESGFPASTLEAFDQFGGAMARIGDLDGDGVAEIAVGAYGSASGAQQGALWILFLASDGSVRDYREIGAGSGGLSPSDLEPFHSFGISLAGLGDLDGDGLADLAVGAHEVGGGGGTGSRLGSVFLLFLQADGSVREHRIVQPPPALLNAGDELARSLAVLGDLNGDGIVDLIAGAPGDDDGGSSGSSNRGAAWILFLQADGSLAGFQKISALEGGFTGQLSEHLEFGDAVAGLGDLDGDGTPDAVAGARFDDDGGTNRGAVWILFLRPDGTLRAHQKISSLEGGLLGGLPDGSFFGSATAGAGDLNGDGVPDLLVGQGGPDIVGPPSNGAVRVLFLARDGTVGGLARVALGEGGFQGPLDDFDVFASSLAFLGDLDGDGAGDMVVGASGDDDGGSQHGAVWILRLDGVACLDFEGGDDLEHTALENGRSLTGSGRFGRTLELTAAGANLGAAIFDSTPQGPNDPSQDLDLLVGLGNVLILQNSQAPTQTVVGIYDRPNDDQDGGTLSFRFEHGPVQPLRLDLIDIDQGPGQLAIVTLIDQAQRARSYFVPAGWTEDLLLHGPPALRTLDLGCLDPQPGYSATATASEVSGFDPRSVTRIEVHLGSSGALDNLCWDPHPDS